MKNEKQANNVEHNLTVRNAIKIPGPCFIFSLTQQRQKQKHKSGREESNILISAVRGGIFLCKEVDCTCQKHSIERQGFIERNVIKTTENEEKLNEK